jgi:hypothetical protein
MLYYHKDQLLYAVWENNRHLLSESYETNKYEYICKINISATIKADDTEHTGL